MRLDLQLIRVFLLSIYIFPDEDFKTLLYGVVINTNA